MNPYYFIEDKRGYLAGFSPVVPYFSRDRTIAVKFPTREKAEETVRRHTGSFEDARVVEIHWMAA